QHVDFRRGIRGGGYVARQISPVGIAENRFILHAIARIRNRRPSENHIRIRKRNCDRWWIENRDTECPRVTENWGTIVRNHDRDFVRAPGLFGRRGPRENAV